MDVPLMSATLIFQPLCGLTVTVSTSKWFMLSPLFSAVEPRITVTTAWASLLMVRV